VEFETRVEKIGVMKVARSGREEEDLRATQPPND
jgi:hypothetical protein